MSSHTCVRSSSVSAQGRAHASRNGGRFNSSVTTRASAITIAPSPTKPIEGQKTGTSGLRKKTAIFTSENYLANWVQSLFSSLGSEIEGQTICLGGDGRYFNKEASQIILKLAAGNGVKKVVVGQNAILATPAASAIIREQKLYGGLIMSASHNPGGPDEDWGIKFNYNSGEPAPERITDEIFKYTETITELKFADIPDVDLAVVGTTEFDGFTVEVVESTADYLPLLQEVFDFDMLKSLFSRPDFSMKFDAMHAVTGAYAPKIFCEMLGAPESSVMNCGVLEDFGGGHPDPNLTYAKELVDIMYSGDDAPDFGAASDGDGDRNMVLGKGFFISPSDSVAMIAANAQECIPYFKDGLKGVARSMPTGGALDKVAEKMGLQFYEVPTGWKFFGNLMDDGRCSVCGEESFGTSSDHVREKDGLWAVLSWLSILAKKNEGKAAGEKLVTVEDIAKEHWAKFGRNFFSRYDYEGVESEKADAMVDHLRSVIASAKKGDKFGEFELDFADDFEYTDPVDGSVASKQGLHFVFTDSSRFIFRLSGTGSSGATIRMYIEQYETDPSKLEMDAQVALKSLIDVALETSKLQEFSGRDKPTVIT